MKERSIQGGLHNQDIIYMMGDVGKFNTVRITQRGHYLQEGWCRKGQYRVDYTTRTLSTGCSKGHYLQDVVKVNTGRITTKSRKGKVNAGHMTQEGPFLQDGYQWYRKCQYRMSSAGN